MNPVPQRHRPAASSWEAVDSAPLPPRTPAPFGWHESSHELARGLEIIEHASPDAAAVVFAPPPAPGG